MTDCRSARSGGWTDALFWAGLGLAVLSAIAVFLLTRSLTNEVERSRFAVAAEQAAHRLARSVDLTLANLRAVKGLYKGSVHVSREEFSAFIQTLRPSPAVQSLEWIPRVQAASRGEIVQTAREEGLLEFAFREYNTEGALIPVQARSEYFPVYYTEPYEANQASLGLDLGADPINLDALLRARGSGEQTASGRVKLTRGQDGQFGIVVFEPVYAETALDLDTRIKSLEGFARGVFRVTDLVRLAIPEDQLQVAVFDLAAPPAERQIYPAPGVDEHPYFQRKVHHDVSLPIADRIWSVRLAPANLSALSTLPWILATLWLGALIVLWTFRELVSSRRHGEELATVNSRLEALSDQREKAIKELERSNRELDDFAYIVSHDLKEPLRAVQNHAHFLLEDYEEQLPDDGKKRLHRLVALSQRLQKLIGDLLYFSRLGRGELAMDTVELNDVVADVEASLAETLQSRRATVMIEKPLPQVQAHRPHMTALFQNLISNGIKYNDRERKTIEIGCMPGEGAPSSADFDTFFVRDNGIGIDGQFKDDVFRMFKRLNGTTAYGDGTGAGLTFAKRIVESQGGAIWLTSTVGQGTTFFFTLRRSDQEAGPEARLQAA